MSNKIYINELLDAYGKLLTSKQQDICEYYYREDLSLSEIAEIMQVSRSAIYDTIHRVEKGLIHYEELLKMVHTSKRRMHIYNEMLKFNMDSNLKGYLNECIQIETEDGEQ